MSTVEQRIDEAFAGLATVEQGHMEQARAIVATLDSPDVVGLWADVEKLLADGALASGSYAYQLQQLQGDIRNNLTTNPVAARARMAEIAQKAPADIKSKYDAAVAAVQDVLPAILLQRSLPTLEEPQARNEAIHEIEMLTAGLSGTALILRIQAIAAGPNRRLAAIAAGSWGYARLGGNDVQYRGVQARAVQGALAHGSPSERAHAVAYGRLSSTALKALTIARTRSQRRLAGHAA
jgi:hypothetical protein